MSFLNYLIRILPCIELYQTEFLTPEVGFKLRLKNGPDEMKSRTSTPELLVDLIGVYNLPASFGVRAVKGFIVTVRLYPGNVKQDSSIQLSSRPSFEETLRFPLANDKKQTNTIMNKLRKSQKTRKINPETLLKGRDVIITIMALFELPQGPTATMTPVDTTRDEIEKLITSDCQQKVGTVTYNLDPTVFDEVGEGQLYQTEAKWLPVNQIRSNQVINSPKGQIEVTLQLCDYTDANLDDYDNVNLPGPSKTSRKSCLQVEPSSGSRPSAPLDFTGAKQIVRSPLNKDHEHKVLRLKISTVKFRCNIAAKREFEQVYGRIYLKTSVLEYGNLTNWWKSEPFRPTLSATWKQDDSSTIEIRLSSMAKLAHISIRAYVAAIDNAGKKVVLGEVKLGPKASKTSMVKKEHWEKMITGKGRPVSMWYNFV